jgi:hypothetical protein
VVRSTAPGTICSPTTKLGVPVMPRAAARSRLRAIARSIWIGHVLAQPGEIDPDRAGDLQDAALVQRPLGRHHRRVEGRVAVSM